MALSAKVEPRSYTYWRWCIFCITWLAYVGFYLTRKSFAVAKSDMAKDVSIQLTVQQMSWMDGANQGAYAIGQFLAGIFGDRFGTRKVVLFGMLSSVVAAAVMGATTSVLLMGVVLTLQGLFQATGWAPLSKNMGYFFSQRERGTIMGFWCTNFAMGGLVGNVLAGYFAQLWGWRFAYYVPALGLLAIAILFWIFQRNRPEDVGLPSVEAYQGEPQPAPLAGDKRESSWQVILATLESPMVLLLGAVYFFVKPLRYAIFQWGPYYVHQKLSTNTFESGTLSAMFELGGPVSILAAGVISDKLFNTRRIPVAVICLVLVSVLLVVFDKLPANKLMIGGSLFLMGILLYAPDSLISGSAAIDFGTKRGASTASGFINGCGSIGAIAGSSLPGVLAKRWGWDVVFQALAASTFIAACLLLPKWNARPKAVVKIPEARSS